MDRTQLSRLRARRTKPCAIPAPDSSTILPNSSGDAMPRGNLERTVSYYVDLSSCEIVILGEVAILIGIGLFVGIGLTLAGRGAPRRRVGNPEPCECRFRWCATQRRRK